jgi:O-antigen ligase
LFNLKIETAHLIIFFKPAVAIGVLYLWPWSMALLRTVPRIQAIVSIAAAGVLLAIYQTGSAVIALLLGVSLALLSWVLGGRAKLCLGLALVVMVLSTSWLARNLPDPTQPGSHLEVLSNSALHRIDIWRTAGRLSAESPLSGIGFDGSRMLFDGSTSRVASFLPDRADGGFSVLSEPIPLHPHNAVLQVWLETGLIGTLLFALFLVSVQTRLLDTGSVARQIVGVGFFISALVIASLSFGAWQSWWLCSLILMSTALKSLLKEPESI